MTEILPLVALEVVVIEVVEDVPDQPPGKVHVYDVAPATGEILYVLDVPEQIAVFPVINPGWAGVGHGETMIVPFIPIEACGVQTK